VVESAVPRPQPADEQAPSFRLPRWVDAPTRPLRRALWRIRHGGATRREAVTFGVTATVVVVGVLGGLVLTVGRFGGVVGGVIAALLWLAALVLCIYPPDGVRAITQPRAIGEDLVGSNPVWAARAGSLARGETALAGRGRSDSVRPATSILAIAEDVPQVAIVVAAYNERRYIEQCLSSLRAQSLERWECVVVDDDSGDKTADLVAAISDEDARIRLVRHSRNRGLAATRNTGLSQVRAPLVTFLDGDDVLTSDSLADRVNAFVQWEAPDLAGTFCGLRNVSQYIDLTVLPPSYPWPSKPAFVDFASAGGVNPFGVHQPLIRTELARTLGGFDESFRVGAEDYEFWMRVMRAGYHFRPSSLLTALYRQKPSSMVRDLIVEHYDSCRRILETLDEPAVLPRASRDAPWPIEEPLGRLQRELVLAERAVRSAGLAIAMERPDRAIALLSRVQPQVAGLALRHVKVGRSLEAGLRRAWGVSQLPADKVLRPHVRRLENTVRGLLVERAAALDTTTVDIREPRRLDLLLCPTNAAQALDMAAAAGDADAMFVSLDEYTDQGATAAAGSTPIEQARLLALVGDGVQFRTLVVSEPMTYWTHAFAQCVVEGGGQVVVLESAAYLPPLPEANVRAPQSARHVTPAELRTLTPGLLVSMADLDLSRLATGAGNTAPLIWEEAKRGRDVEALMDLKDAFKGERCIIIGNGPSLNQMDLSLLANVPTFAVNGIFYAQEKMGFEPTFYVVEDNAVMADNTEQIRDYRAKWKLFPTIYRKHIGEDDNVVYFRMNRGFYHSESPHYCVPRFSTDASNRVYCGQSVTIINLQLAYHFGFTDVALVGMDFSYTIPDSVEREGDLLTSTEDDPNHFHPEYFGKGKTWKDPKLDRVLASYELAKRMYEADGRRILNATVGGNLQAFPRVAYEDFLA
jgi:glycosyltransferase involved in cell wall biosynthesis